MGYHTIRHGVVLSSKSISKNGLEKIIHDRLNSLSNDREQFNFTPQPITKRIQSPQETLHFLHLNRFPASILSEINTWTDKTMLTVRMLHKTAVV